MTDNAIITALECCKNGNACSNCPYNGKCTDEDFNDNYLLKDIIDLIKRQKAEIKQLKKRIDGQKHALFKQQCYTAELQNQLKQAKPEAIKEFADLLCKDRVSNDPIVIAVQCQLKEMEWS